MDRGLSCSDAMVSAVGFSWSVAESLAAAHMRALGFPDARVTSAGADRGIDVVATDGVAQVKYLSRPVGGPDIQRLRGAAFGVEAVLFYANTGYTTAALQAANESGIALFTYDEAGTVLATNLRASALIEHAGTRVERSRLTAALWAILEEQRAWADAVQRQIDERRQALRLSREAKSAGDPASMAGHERVRAAWEAAAQIGEGNTILESIIEANQHLQTPPYDIARAAWLTQDARRQLEFFKAHAVAVLGPVVRQTAEDERGE
jgi:hypothetical protein